MSVEPAPDVSQPAETVQAPVVTVIVPLEPPVIVTLFRTTVEALAVKVPRLPTLRSGVSTELPRSSPPVAKTEPPAESVIDRVLNHRSPRVPIVNVREAAFEELNVTLLNSASERFEPAKVCVSPTESVKVMVPVPASQAESVDEFVY